MAKQQRIAMRRGLIVADRSNGLFTPTSGVIGKEKTGTGPPPATARGFTFKQRRFVSLTHKATRFKG